MTPSTFKQSDLFVPGRFPVAIDNTMRKQFAACRRSFRNKFIEHFRPTAKSVHLIAGAAFAKGIEVGRKSFHIEGLSEEVSIANAWAASQAEYGDFVPQFETPKTRWRVGEAVIEYFDRYQLPHDPVQPHRHAGLPCVEMSFGIPLPIKHPDTGDPILYCGRFDMVGEFQSSLYVVDEKTTSRLGAQWEAQWDLDSQFLSYCWAAKHMGYPVAGAIIRGISFLKNDYGHSQVLVYHPSAKIERWYRQLCRDVVAMIECYRSGYFDFSFGPGCSNYSGCEFRSSCSAADPDKVLEMDYIREFWSPIKIDGGIARLEMAE